SIRDALLVSNTDREIIDCNQAFTDLFGYTLEEIRGKETAYLYADTEDYEKMDAKLRQHMVDPQFPMTFQYQKQSGETFPAETSAFYLRNPEGEITGFIGLIRDVTDRKQMEYELIEAQKMEALGQIAGGIAHDFNNVLAAISGAQQMLELQIQNETMHRYLKMIKSSVERGKTVTNRMLTFTRSSKLDVKPVALGSFLEEFKDITKYTLPQEIQIHIEEITNQHTVEVDPVQFQQVLFTLSINAADAMPDGGTIQCTVRQPTERERRVFLRGNTDPYWCLLVTDEGIGMDEETMALIFEPFFTTKESTQGTGLGLAVVYKILQMHNGWIDVESTPGEGSTFIVGLPACNPEGSPAVMEKSIIQGDGETILIVDDEESIRNMVDETLSTNGYQTIQAETAQQALDVLLDSPSSVHLVLTDIGFRI
ncbi:MAG: PAS domain S-box protein, partial [Lentisphaeria bacterium]|nr:PAS domain S-box protein [Lentisphaeria bacterium]